MNKIDFLKLSKKDQLEILLTEGTIIIDYSQGVKQFKLYTFSSFVVKVSVLEGEFNVEVYGYTNKESLFTTSSAVE